MDQPRPFYARVLRLRHIRPGVVACFVFLEGSFAVAAVLALAGLVSVWAILIVPVVVAIAVKLNDVVAGALWPSPAPVGSSPAAISAAGPARLDTARLETRHAPGDR